MGLHCGYIVATASATALLEELARHTGEFTLESVVDRTADADIDPAGFDMLLGEIDGRACLLDTSMTLSDSPDMIVTMSTTLGTVVGCGAETTSGSYWLTAARAGQPLRHVFVSHAAMTRGMAIGEPLPCEKAHPIEDISGSGVFAAMAAFGLDPSVWLNSGPARVVKYDHSRPAVKGPIAAIVRGHYERYKRPGGEWLHHITAVVRDESR
ncbi:hypothetical protein GCM10023170_076040 [Phytohabitans houttuyneae]|uniref:Uncharacterized protein n=2 Tax=Phytohabitans houttuyneae TaxID=1076126 RepID=A0A6V8KF74_9ACTN|nr:hypothetical protein Phou_080220 [Phytohabitans houttuyneae]